MNNLHIEKTKYTMEINFNSESGILEMNGSSYPENSLDFFGPIIDWVREYVTTVKKPVTMNINLSYLNTSSTKCILDIFELLEDLFHQGVPVKINWHYATDDEDILETGEELGEDFAFPIEYIPY